jgi:predicted RNA binding protein YcfA (HicA-like mRNA interferase family)
MKLPRNLSGSDLIKALARLGYVPTRQKGSHIRLTTAQQGTHHISIPRHDSLRVGTLAAILQDVASHFGITREEVLQRLFP